MNSCAPAQCVMFSLCIVCFFFKIETIIRIKVCYIPVTVFGYSSLSVECIFCQILATMPLGHLSLYVLYFFVIYWSVQFNQQYQFL